MDPLLLSERAWQLYQVKYSFLCARDFLNEHKKSFRKFSHAEFINVLEISAMRLLTLQNNPNSYIVLSDCSYQKIFRVTEDEMISPDDLFCKAGEDFDDTKTTSAYAIKKILVKYIPVLQKAATSKPANKQYADRLGVLFAVLLFNLKNTDPDLFIMFQNSVRIPFHANIFRREVVTVLRGLFSQITTLE